MTVRCEWVGDDPLYVDYHDQEWGVPVHDDRALFARLLLDGAQAGLSWNDHVVSCHRYEPVGALAAS